MIGKVAMEVSKAEMCAAIQFYLSKSVFDSDLGNRVFHKAKVTNVRQRDNGRFVIEFEGQPESVGQVKGEGE